MHQVDPHTHMHFFPMGFYFGFLYLFFLPSQHVATLIAIGVSGWSSQSVSQSTYMDGEK